MDEKYRSLGTAGTHRGTVTGGELNQSVRAPEPHDVTAQGRPVGRTFIHERNEKEGWDRFRLYPEDNLPEPSRGSTEQGRYVSMDEIAGALRNGRDQRRWIVLENTRTGEAAYHEEVNVSGDWTSGGQYDQATVFETQEAAAAYADGRQKASGR